MIYFFLLFTCFLWHCVGIYTDKYLKMLSTFLMLLVINAEEIKLFPAVVLSYSRRHVCSETKGLSRRPPL